MDPLPSVSRFRSSESHILPAAEDTIYHRLIIMRAKGSKFSQFAKAETKLTLGCPSFLTNFYT